MTGNRWYSGIPLHPQYTHTPPHSTCEVLKHQNRHGYTQMYHTDHRNRGKYDTNSHTLYFCFKQCSHTHTQNMPFREMVVVDTIQKLKVSTSPLPHPSLLSLPSHHSFILQHLCDLQLTGMKTLCPFCFCKDCTVCTAGRCRC